MNLQISKRVFISDNEIELSAVRSQGSGGQHVNKVATAIQLRFDIKNSSLPKLYKDRLLKINDKRITKDGVIIIKSQQERSQWQNREIALKRLVDLIKSVSTVPKKRIPTNTTKNSRENLLEKKAQRGQIKSLRGKINSEDDL